MKKTWKKASPKESEQHNRTQLHFARRELKEVEALLVDFDKHLAAVRHNREIAVMRRDRLLEEIKRYEEKT
jgi:hypothetical protein